MSQSWFVFLLIIYGLSILVYIIHSLARKTKLVLLPVFVLMPLLGPLLMALVGIGGALGKKDIDAFTDDEPEREKFDYLTQINDEKEINIVPMKEAMALNKTSTQRDIVFELAKGNPTEYIKNLKHALLSEDSEVAHYAASSISKFKRELDMQLVDLEAVFQDEPHLSKNRTALIKALDDAIKAKLATGEELIAMRSRIIEVLMMELRLGEAVGKEYYIMICEYLLEVEDYESYESWVSEFKTRFPEADDPLRLDLQYAYRTKNKALFEAVLDEAQNAKYAITKETLNMLHFWKQGGIQ